MRLLYRLLAVSGLLVLGTPPGAAQTPETVPGYVGSQICASCHQSEGQSWIGCRQSTRSGQSRLGAIPVIGDRPGQCLVSDGFETKTGRAHKAKPTQIKKFAIHTLGHELPFAMTRIQVCNAAMNRHSSLSVGNAAVSVPSNAPCRTHALCQERTLENSISTWMARGPFSPPAAKVHP